MDSRRLAITLFISILLSPAAFAKFPLLTTTFNNVSGTDISPTAVTLYASTLGRAAATSCTSGATCNTCTANPSLLACNSAAIDPTSSLSIEFTTTVDGVARIMQSDGVTTLNGSTAPAVIAGQRVTISVPWSDVCSYITASDTLCAQNGSKNIVIGVDPYVNGSPSGNLTNAMVRQSVSIQMASNVTCDTTAECSNGIYKFDMRAGDTKAYLRNLTTSNGSFPVISGAPANIGKIRAYYTLVTSGEPCDSASSLTSASPYFETDVTKPAESIELSGDAIRGLTNLSRYVFKLALVDKANNVYYFTDNTHCGDLLSSNGTYVARAAEYGQHAVIPDEVTGLLGDGNNCFIATATYGSALDPHVQTFRDFRDRVLLKTDFGKKLVGLYYQFSPALADTIKENEFLRAVSRLLLWPLWAIASLVTKFGVMLSVLVLTSLYLLVQMVYILLGPLKSLRQAPPRAVRPVSNRDAMGRQES
ncbi:MAG: hypothetical protein K2X47_16985 [Bdellovibrionales bacterium]|nr:hypothetical protein [Bdellovibrionales bacterium]